jgi:hypothetical protein
LDQALAQGVNVVHFEKEMMDPPAADSGSQPPAKNL